MRSAAVAMSLLALSGCALVREPTPPAPSPPVTPAAPPIGRQGQSPADEVIAYLGQLRAMGEPALAAEGRRQRTAARAGPEGDLARVKAGLAFILATATEEAEILALVDPVAKREKSDPGLRAMASFLHELAVDRRRLKESAAAANARLRDEKRAQEQLRGTAAAAQERAAQLQQKLDALTELEKSLSDRKDTTR